MNDILQVEHLSKQFGGLKAVNDFSMTVQEGEIHALIGPNGAGKTTLFNLISGFIPPSAGKVIFAGQDVTNAKPYRLCSKGLVRTYQIVQPFRGMSTLDNVMVGGFTHTDKTSVAREKARKALEITKLDRKADVQARSLNLCEQKRLEVARALATEPKLIMLDEVMAGLNPTEVAEVMEIVMDIKRLGITIVIIEHIMQAVMSISDNITVLSFGEKIAEGKPDEIAADPNVISVYLGSDYAQE
ncbi:ABC transporter ATP-binding protein [Anaerofilum sp. BX8]|uniref:ABC transporter ATP-binding protein n=1 Tax=Anaerofilum hominis TaxID=2763016 RepID=A0A923L267_9FIRM|nr:ABC transporter ATP-binding protein [Anaerofilum hominis]MBC5582488.1 ABC transporter ATP-binding protein [Anaerofilum hominis]